MAGERIIEIGRDHPWSPPKPTALQANLLTPLELPTERSPPQLQKRGGMPNVTAGNKGSHQAHHCYLPGMDLLVVQVFNFGLDEEGYWAWRGTYTPPYKIEHRIAHLARGYMDGIASVSGRPARPDLVYLSSALWDTARFQRLDIADGRDTAEPLAGDRVRWYRARVRAALVVVRETFPSSPVRWISNTYPIKPSMGWFFSDIPSDHKGSRPAQSLVRLAQLQAAARSAIEDLEDADPREKEMLRGVSINRWGEKLLGFEGFQVDDLHPALLPGSYLWADMMMWDLRAAVLGGL